MYAITEKNAVNSKYQRVTQPFFVYFPPLLSLQQDYPIEIDATIGVTTHSDCYRIAQKKSHMWLISLAERNEEAIIAVVLA